jgi:hypothetical protein
VLDEIAAGMGWGLHLRVTGSGSPAMGLLLIVEVREYGAPNLLNVVRTFPVNGGSGLLGLGACPKEQDPADQLSEGQTPCKIDWTLELGFKLWLWPPARPPRAMTAAPQTFSFACAQRKCGLMLC